MDFEAQADRLICWLDDAAHGDRAAAKRHVAEALREAYETGTKLRIVKGERVPFDYSDLEAEAAAEFDAELLAIKAMPSPYDPDAP